MSVLDCLLAALLLAGATARPRAQKATRGAEPDDSVVDLREDGGYGFRYSARDQGAHYGEAQATPDNTVTGKFGYREPGTGRNLETRYTAGERGFRAQGPSIHRRMDLSQVKLPYNPPVPQDSPAYNPSYSTYYDPNEDSSYHFDFATNEYKRTETGGPRGQVAGAYSFIDDVGDIHNVEFEAGSQTGFHVKTPYPDSNHNYNELYFRGDGKVPLRGRTSIQQAVDGSYRFTSHSQDQRRSEVKDAQGNTRGSYTYIDKDGVQRTVQYIAGANIGYKIVNQGLGPALDPIFPYTNQNYIPSSLQGAGGKPGFGPGGILGSVGGGKPPKGSKPTRPQSSFGFDQNPSSTGKPGGDGFGQDGNQFGGGGNSFGGDDSSSSGGGDGSFGGGESAFGGPGFNGGGGSSAGGGGSSGGSGRPLGGSSSGSSGSSGGDNGISSEDGDGTSGGSFGGGSHGVGNGGGSSTTSSPPHSCCPASTGGFDSHSGGSGNGGGSVDGIGASQGKEPPYPPSGQKPSNGLKEPIFTPVGKTPMKPNRKKPTTHSTSSRHDFLSPTTGFPPHAGFPEEDPDSPKPYQKPSFKPFTVEDNLFLQRPFSSLPPANPNSGFYTDRADDLGKVSSFARPSISDNFQDKDGAFSDDEFIGFPPGVSVKGWVQNLDINPFGNKVPAPGEALERFSTEKP